MIKYAIALVVALLLNASANLMIRFGMRAVDLDLGGAGLLDQGILGGVRLLLRHWVLLAGIGCFALNVGFYAYALRKMPISVAYPIMVTVGFVIIVVVAGMFLKERLTAWQWAGVAAVLIGVSLVAKDAAVQMGAEAQQARPAATRAEGHVSTGPEH